MNSTLLGKGFCHELAGINYRQLAIQKKNVFSMTHLILKGNMSTQT